MSKIRVVLIEDNDLSRIGLTTLLQQVEEIDVVGNAGNAKEGLKLIQHTQPDVLLLDIGLPDMDGIELTQMLKQSSSQEETTSPRVLMLTMYRTEESVLTAFAAGADSYALKDISLENLVQAIQATYEGNAWIDPSIAKIILKKAKESQKKELNLDNNNIASQTRVIESVEPEYQEMIESDPLTDRELEVLELIVAGCNNAQIAEQLFITVGTVKTHVRNILNKLCVDDRTQAAVQALRSGLVD